MSRHTIDSFTADLLREIEDAEAVEKTAAETAKKPVLSAELSVELMKVAHDLAYVVDQSSAISYDDLSVFIRSRF